jgi:hypothetical protein
MMRQEAPDPVVLFDLVAMLEYRPGWRFSLGDEDRGQGSKGLTFTVVTTGLDTYHPERGETYRVAHSFIVPAAAYNEQSWMAWIRDRLIDVETHEACEFLQFNGHRVFAPHHGPGEDPYVIFTHGDDVARRTSFRGDVDEPRGRPRAYHDGRSLDRQD